jgi:DNA-binding CsgD family transcriptional regulator
MAAEPSIDYRKISPGIDIVSNQGPSVPIEPAYRRVSPPEVLRSSSFDPLKLLAQGKTHQEIGEALGIRDVDVKNRLGMIQTLFRTESNRASFQVALERGIIVLEEVLPKDFDPDVFTRVEDPKSRKILTGILKGADYAQIASSLGMRETDVAERVLRMKALVGANNNFQIFVFGLAAEKARAGEVSIFDPVKKHEFNPDIAQSKGVGVQAERPAEEAELKGQPLDESEKEVLSFYAMGYREFEIKHLTGASHTGAIKEVLKRVKKKLNASTYSHSIWNAALTKQIDLQSLVPRDFDPNVLKSLTGEESVFLESLISTSTTGSSVDIDREKFDQLKKSICQKLDVERLVQAEVFLMESKRREMGGEVSPDVKRYGPPKSGSRRSVEKIKKELAAVEQG